MTECQNIKTKVGYLKPWKIENIKYHRKEKEK